jgi:hypothetical protein
MKKHAFLTALYGRKHAKAKGELTRVRFLVKASINFCHNLQLS